MNEMLINLSTQNSSLSWEKDFQQFFKE